MSGAAWPIGQTTECFSSAMVRIERIMGMKDEVGLTVGHGRDQTMELLHRSAEGDVGLLNAAFEQ